MSCAVGVGDGDGVGVIVGVGVGVGTSSRVEGQPGVPARNLWVPARGWVIGGSRAFLGHLWVPGVLKATCGSTRNPEKFRRLTGGLGRSNTPVVTYFVLLLRVL